MDLPTNRPNLLRVTRYVMVEPAEGIGYRVDLLDADERILIGYVVTTEVMEYGTGPWPNPLRHAAEIVLPGQRLTYHAFTFAHTDSNGLPTAVIYRVNERSHRRGNQRQY